VHDLLHLGQLVVEHGLLLGTDHRQQLRGERRLRGRARVVDLVRRRGGQVEERCVQELHDTHSNSRHRQPDVPRTRLWTGI
jgi:hypothetical protein